MTDVRDVVVFVFALIMLIEAAIIGFQARFTLVGLEREHVLIGVALLLLWTIGR